MRAVGLSLFDFAVLDHLCSLAFITWTKKQLEDYAEIFRKQVYTKDVDPKVVAEAISITLMQSRKVPLLYFQKLSHIHFCS